MFMKSEKRRGLSSDIYFKCDMCNAVFCISTDDHNSTKIDVNMGAVSGIVSVGGGFSKLEEILACMDILCMSKVFYSKKHERVSDGWKETAMEKMKAAYHNF
ncbi:hypothetical protein Zmor_021693 [Zophobas morio]|uniref:Mutator-like transposase domain-containing protein n=1 Tax=Zophobas morio TaxID=2755281 RepID=A0AA38I5Z8_9CUCU|nr:hypothetical protein Zmor_021693 [Zophobas morio]